MPAPLRFRAWHNENKKMYDVWQIYMGEQGGFMGRSPDGEVLQQVGLPGMFVMMQSTGLKDRNGKEVFEGDVVNVLYAHEEGEPFCTQEVRWDREGGYLAKDECGNDFTPLLGNSDLLLEVIGNIYENPDLLS